MENSKETTSVEVKKVAQRSHAYPSHLIQSSIDYVTKIHTGLGNTSHNTRETIAKVLGLSPASVTIPLSSCVQYGLIEMKSKIGYKPTQRFERIRKPLNEQEKKDALLECFKNPTLYEGLIAEFSGNILPVQIGLSTILYRKYHISESASEKAAEIFIENARNLGLLNDENRLIISSQNADNTEQNIDSIPIVETETVTKHTTNNYLLQSPTPKFTKPANEQQSTIVNNPDANSIDIPLRSGQFIAKLVVPKDVTNEDLNKIAKFIEALRE